ncbi:ankyrin repeat-containing domain protein [Lophiotrema nucula]|uniref:Ankyrin repeat-containing domain protein n=1 Tax=Lophiotrema nucula TaxID=690887 RepID=A0A6A5ZC83_9PLEO|nr:ankyrin repeat-containing domain protein [Lophiotrema nucula]
MEKLPIELLQPTIEVLLQLHLPHPRKASLTLHELLETRRVCRSFDQAVLKALHGHITFPHISFYRRSFRPPQSAIAFTSTRNSLLASALYRSCQSFEYRLVGTAVCTRLLNCLKIAQAIADDFSERHKQELLKLLCDAASKSPYNTVILPAQDSKATDQDANCIAAILSSPTHLDHKVRGKWWYAHPTASIFGNPLAYAAMYGRIEVLKATLDRQEGKASSVGPMERSMVEAAIEGGQATSLRWLFEIDSLLKFRLGHDWKVYILRAVRVGNLEVLEVLLETYKGRNVGQRVLVLKEFVLLRQFALMHAVRFGRIEVVRYLIGKGVRINRLGDTGQTALALARKLGFMNVEALLLEHGATMEGQERKKVVNADHAVADKEMEGFERAGKKMGGQQDSLKSSLVTRVLKRVSSSKK